MKLQFSKEIYPKTALIKASYAFTDRAYLHLDSDIDNYYVTIQPKDNCKQVTENDFVNEMLCQCVRYTVYLQTKEIRSLLTARAMASSIIEVENNVESIENECEPDMDNILLDWFDSSDKG